MAKKVEKKALVPELRFPEFREDRTWDCFNGDQLFAQINDRNHNGDLPVLAITQDFGAIPRDLIDYNVSVSESSVNNYKIVRVGDFIISLRSFQGGIEFSNYEGLCSPAYVVLREKRDTSSSFFKHFFKSKIFTRELTKNLEGLRDGKMISYRQFSDVGINLPRKAEQQKIADCLGSLDDLIAAHSAKLAALQDHKKGLLQQLFPAEGETVPKLRFPEFEDAGEWEEKRVDECGEVLAGKALAVNAPGPLRPYLRTKNVFDGAIELSDVRKMPMTDAEFDRFEVLNGDILLNEGQSLEFVGRAAVYRGEYEGRCAMQNQLLRFRAYPSTCTEFAAQAFRKCQKDGTFANIATKTTSVAHLGCSRFSSLKLAWPHQAEQQKIADCLGDLDALISAQTEQIAALIDHKKGLMQQLFPNPDLKKA